MLAFLSTVAVPTLAFILMLIVGLDLEIADFRRVLRYPRTVIVAVLGQVLLLPVLALTVVAAFQPNQAISMGMLLLAVSPGGAISNYYASLARQNVALSVTLTAISTVLSLLSIPLWAIVYATLAAPISSTPFVPVSTIILQLAAFVILPIMLGMRLGATFRTRLETWMQPLRMLSLVLVWLILAASIWTVREEFAADFLETVRVAFVFTTGAMLVGAIVAAFLNRDDQPVVVIECAVRNIPIAVLIGTATGLSPAFTGFVATYFLVEVTLLIPYAFWLRQKKLRAA